MRFSRTLFVPVLVTGLLAAAASGLVIGLATGCGRTHTRDVPSQLLGVWRTSHPRYEGRYFEIRPATFVIGVTGDRVLAHPLRAVETSTIGEQQRYTLYYVEADGSESTFRFFFDGAIRQVSQQDVEWTKTESSHGKVKKS